MNEIFIVWCVLCDVTSDGHQAYRLVGTKTLSIFVRHLTKVLHSLSAHACCNGFCHERFKVLLSLMMRHYKLCTTLIMCEKAENQAFSFNRYVNAKILLVGLVTIIQLNIFSQSTLKTVLQ